MVISAERLAEVADSHRFQWKVRLTEFLIPRLTGDIEAKEQALEMVFAALDQSHSDGVEDAAYIAEHLGENLQDDRGKQVATVIASNLRKLISLNQRL